MVDLVKYKNEINNNIKTFCNTLIKENEGYFNFEESIKSNSIYFTIYDNNIKFEKTKICQLRFSDHNHPISGKGFLSLEYWNNLSFDEFKNQTKEYILKELENCSYYGNSSKEDIINLLNVIIKTNTLNKIVENYEEFLESAPTLEESKEIIKEQQVSKVEIKKY